MEQMRPIKVVPEELTVNDTRTQEQFFSRDRSEKAKDRVPRGSRGLGNVSHVPVGNERQAALARRRIFPQFWPGHRRNGDRNGNLGQHFQDSHGMTQ